MTSPKLTTRRLALLSGFALLGVVGIGSVCSAESPWRRRSRPVPPPYRLTLVAPDGSPLPTFAHDGQLFALGMPGDRYNIRVENPTPERVEVVLTVDGRDAVSGDVGDYVSQRGYLIEPWGSLVVEGFRRSLEEVAAFRFTGKAGSYSALRGTPQHVGVVGAAFFQEKPRPPAPVYQPPRPIYPPRRGYDSEREYPTRHPHTSEYRGGSGASAAPGAAQRGADATAAPAPPAPAARPSPRAEGDLDRHDFREREEAPRKSRADAGPSNIGTEYGEDESSSVVEVAFERRTPTHPSAIVSLRYDDYDGLEARGIDLSSLGYGYAYRDEEPQPFPANRRFAPPP